jgi:hypothetical protein
VREEEVSWSSFGAERIPETADGVNQFNGFAFVDLAAEETDESVQGVLFDIFGGAPNSVKNGAARGDAAFVAHEEFEQTKFGGSEMDFASSAKDAALGEFQGKVADSESVRSRLGDAALQRADAGEQDGEGERLGHVIVGARIETLDDVGNGIASRQHQNGNVLAKLAETAGDLNAIDSGQHDIEEDEVELVVFGERKSGEAVVSEAYGMIVFLEATAKDLGHSLLVFDYEDFHLN